MEKNSETNYLNKYEYSNYPNIKAEIPKMTNKKVIGNGEYELDQTHI